MSSGCLSVKFSSNGTKSIGIYFLISVIFKVVYKLAGPDVDPYMFEEGGEIDPMIKERFSNAGKKSTTPKQVPGIDDQSNLSSLQQLENQVCMLLGHQMSSTKLPILIGFKITGKFVDAF